jgi:hypothetical protein
VVVGCVVVVGGVVVVVTGGVEVVGVFTVLVGQGAVVVTVTVWKAVVVTITEVVLVTVAVRYSVSGSFWQERADKAERTTAIKETRRSFRVCMDIVKPPILLDEF